SQWLAEATEGNLQTGKLSQITLRANKLAIFVALSNEVIEDSISGGAIFADIMGGALGYDMNQVLLTGTGAGQPMGFINADSTITVSKESGQAADTLLFPNIVNMWARLHPACHRTAVWYVSSDVVPQLLTMQFVQSADHPVPIFTTSGANSAPMMTLM